METLHNIFHKGLIKTYLAILVISSISTVVSIHTFSNEGSGAFYSTIKIMSLLGTFLLPLLTVFMNGYFTKNVKWLINQNFNRAELIKFFFFSQTLKFGLLIINLMINLCIGLVLMKGNSLIDETSGFELNSYMYYLAFVMMLAIFYIFYSCFLFSANKEDIQRAKINNIKKNKKQYKLIVLLIGCMIYLSENFELPVVLGWYGLSFFICFSSFFVFNRTFRIYASKKKYSHFGILSFVICLPLLVLILCMRSEVKDERVSYKDRAETVVSLNWLSPSFNKKQMVGFLTEVENIDYMSMLEMFGDKIGFLDSMMLVDDQYKAKKFIDFHSRRKTENQVKELIGYMSMMYEANNYGFEFATYSESFFVEQKVGKEYILELYRSKNSYKQLAAVYFTKRNLKTKEALELYTSKISGLNMNVKNSRYVKRWIDRVESKKLK